MFHLAFSPTHARQKPSGRRLPHLRMLTFATMAIVLAACSSSASDHAQLAAEIDKQTTCSLDGMLLSEYPGPKAQIFYEGQDKPDFFCDTIEMFHTVLLPEQVKKIRAIFIQDMGKADWENPSGNWFDARQGYFVMGSQRTGSMGPTIASFAQEADAKIFIAKWGGKLLKFSDIKADMVDLSGGALHDSKM